MIQRLQTQQKNTELPRSSKLSIKLQYSNYSHCWIAFVASRTWSCEQKSNYAFNNSNIQKIYRSLKTAVPEPTFALHGTFTGSARMYSSCTKPSTERWRLMSQCWRDPLYHFYEEAENRLGRKMSRMWSHILCDIDSYPSLRLPSLPSVHSLTTATATVNNYTPINQIWKLFTTSTIIGYHSLQQPERRL